MKTQPVPGIDFDIAYTKWEPEEIRLSIRGKRFYEALSKREGKNPKRWLKERLELEAALEWHQERLKNSTLKFSKLIRKPLTNPEKYAIINIGSNTN